MIAAIVLDGSNSADAYEFRGGVSLGGILVGALPRFSVSPHGGIAWQWEGGFLIAIHDACNLVPAVGKLGFGVYNQTSASIGYTSKSFDMSLGPSFAAYSLPACGPSLCGRVVGVAPGGNLLANFYFASALGVSVNAGVDWVGGSSLVLPGGWVGKIVLGPVLRWEAK